MRLSLASASPRRKSLLAAAGIGAEISPSDVDETILGNEAPMTYVLRVARAKAGAYRGPCEAVLAADTTVALDGAILAKADDDLHATRMLRRLSGRTHAVHTAVVLKTPSGTLERVVSTEVRFRTLSESEIARYIRTGEHQDKAGAYGIQGAGGALVDALVGSYTNVVGLPLEETIAMLRAAGAL